jgi:hypothetical protein
MREDPITDVGFKKAIDAVSASGRLRWGVEHLPYELARRHQRRRQRLRVYGVSFALLVGLGLVIGALGATVLGVLMFLGFGLATIAAFSLARQGSLSSEKFAALWSRWIEVHGQPDGVIIRQSKATRPILEADIGDYSFDRAVICDRPRTADLLLANNFHFEHSCAVLAIGGYPRDAFDTVRAMLQRNPRLHAYALHDATVAGCQMAHELATGQHWFGGRIRVVDLGLRPKQVARFRGLWRKEHVPLRDDAPGIDPGEVGWLRTHSLELAILRPEQILKSVSRALTGRAASESTSDTLVDSQSSGGSDGGGSDGDVDAFG